ncbi:1-acyl-sn-glycerol-3-phosphate acyltransferase [Pontibacter sp. G13]|uniref:1-acyl-sn-glycerol-3-phosphate acyltransferase n=1 Tax=Pontibacter sp. G13 TaxID=3074898 RepID=UPI00288B034B|nr:1-acyl-sn-glycerol-3-phosphate acyltransferase [Pontibacter sp. G13]WNJ20803.1 1-acyl-sn-glycerol-3-phosphate acyltransferase [Pontibacter sp. G13]
MSWKNELHKVYYGFLRVSVRFTLKRYYRRMEEAQRQENLPKGYQYPVILAPNHQNAFIDAVNVVCTAHPFQRPSFLTRSDVFKGFAGTVLKSFKMLPIYRARDGVDTVAANKPIFDLCVSRLTANEQVLIFPEGNHGRKPFLRPLKKGVSRIAFQAAEANNFDFPLKIVPVGLNYNDHTKYHQNFLVVYGEPIDLNQFYDNYHENPNRTLGQVKEAVKEGMIKVMIHITKKEYQNEIDSLRYILTHESLEEMGLSDRTLYNQFLAQKAVIKKIEDGLDAQQPAAQQLIDEVEDYNKTLKEAKLRDDVVRKGPNSLFVQILKGLVMAVGAPIFAVGTLINYLPYKLPDVAAKKMFKDDHFHSSVQMLGGMVLFPIWYLLIFLITWLVADWKIGLGLVATAAISGEFAIYYSHVFKRWWGSTRYSLMHLSKKPVAVKLQKMRAGMVRRYREISQLVTA